jgi:hypothetical protein
MNQLKRLAGTLFLVLALLMVGCGSEQSSNLLGSNQEQTDKVEQGEDDLASLLTLEQVLGAFAREELTLDRSAIDDPNAFAIGGLEPQVFANKGAEVRVFVYVFPTIEDRKKVVSHPLTPVLRLPRGFQRQGSLSYALPAKNTLIVYFDPDYGQTAQDKSKRLVLNRIKEVFWQLNGGKRVVLRGQSTNWEGEVEIRHFTYFWQDSRGRLYHEGYSAEEGYLRYTGKNPEEVGIVTYQVNRGSGSSDGRTKLNRDGIIPLSHRGNGVPFTEDLSYPVTVEWNGQKETFVLSG